MNDQPTSTTILTDRERIVLEFLSPLMEANAIMIGRHLYETKPGRGSNLPALGAAVCGRLKKRGLVLYLSDLRAWRISRAGREALS